MGFSPSLLDFLCLFVFSLLLPACFLFLPFFSHFSSFARSLPPISSVPFTLFFPSPDSTEKLRMSAVQMVVCLAGSLVASSLRLSHRLLSPPRCGCGVRPGPEVTGRGSSLAMVLSLGLLLGPLCWGRAGDRNGVLRAARAWLWPGHLACDFCLGLRDDPRAWRPSWEGNPELPRPGGAVRRDPEHCPPVSCSKSPKGELSSQCVGSSQGSRFRLGGREEHP